MDYTFIINVWNVLLQSAQLFPETSDEKIHLLKKLKLIITLNVPKTNQHLIKPIETTQDKYNKLNGSN